ncbi:hypothetical protein GPECTOR_37g234 [Gonium pectorale]|uniref:Uncharacterized protein n=1 Tax=Gonium pectorale TaxID=33097 RepID=A0A150GBM7_GONPE|nr:hypothetical protein GPECTOR_37g234 [Gonium pectorale]|eukprot:KXZ47228.1 hypothetical protein GPECTOR_37g234 [Gonium pectorale]
MAPAVEPRSYDSSSGGAETSIPAPGPQPSRAPADAIRSVGSLGSAHAPTPLTRTNPLATLAKLPRPVTAPPPPAARADERSAAALEQRSGGARRRQDSGEVSDEGSDEVDEEAEVFGNLKTSLVWDCSGRRLCLSARQYVETPRKLEVKARGMLDSASGAAGGRAGSGSRIRIRNSDPGSGDVALGGSLRLKAVHYGLTGGQDLRLALGLDFQHDEAGRLRRMPYVHVSDGKLSARLQNRRWQILYSMM